MNATWESARLKTPDAARQKAGDERHGGAELWKWLEPAGEEKRQQHYEAARDLARYFMLDQGSDSRVGRALQELGDDPYPELSQLGLDNEWVLKTLTETPELLYADGWDNVEEVGRQTLKLLGEDPGGEEEE